MVDKNEPPELSGPAAVPFAEGGAGEVARYGAEDPEGTPVRWTLSGPDEGAFTIVGGWLEFKETARLRGP